MCVCDCDYDEAIQCQRHSVANNLFLFPANQSSCKCEICGKNFGYERNHMANECTQFFFYRNMQSICRDFYGINDKIKMSLNCSNLFAKIREKSNKFQSHFILSITTINCRRTNAYHYHNKQPKSRTSANKYVQYIQYVLFFPSIHRETNTQAMQCYNVDVLVVSLPLYAMYTPNKAYREWTTNSDQPMNFAHDETT